MRETSNYLYNALEQLVQRSTTAPGGPKGTVQYLYGLDGSLLAEADAATGKTLREYIWLPQDDISPAADNDNEEGAEPPPLPLALVTGASTATPALLTVHADHLGRPTRLTDATRATVWQASYDPFGQPVTVTGTVEQNLRFPGQYFLIESGMAYNWHRVYDPATGRYTQPDPLRFVDGPSVYGYVGASPLMEFDYWGLRPLTDREKNLLGPYIPRIDLDNADVLTGKRPWFPVASWVGAITINNKIYFPNPNQTFCTPDDVAQLGHELVHVGQYRNGMTWPKYFGAFLDGGYEGSEYEKPAFDMGDRISKELKPENCLCSIY